MNKPVLVAIHGMGTHTKKSFKEEVTSTLDEASKHFSFFKDKNGKHVPFSKKVLVEIIEYNSYFEAVRNRLQDGTGSISERLKRLKNIDSISKALKKVEVDFKKNSFFNTHWLDVLLYKYSVYGEMIRVKVGEELVDKLIKYKDSAKRHDVHLLSHSLGTAVMHDTLHEVFTDGVSRKGKVSIDDYQFDSLYAIANVSRLINASRHPYESLVKPEQGVCKQMVNIAHRLDPITWPLRFDPKIDGHNWVSADTYQLNLYREFRTEAITEPNTHSITSYLANPKTYRDIFQTIFPFDFFPTTQEVEDADNAYIKKTLKGATEELADVLKNTNIKDVTSIERLSKELESFKIFWESFKETV